LFAFLNKDVVRDGVPGIVNANEEQEQRRSAHEEQGRARMGVSRACPGGKHCVSREWKQNMKQPVLEHGPVGGLQSQAPGHEDDVHYPNEAH
jgi:hypothetical protein